ncbi:MAG: DUF4397 domain-containing protein [Terriglobales bacterium]
MLRMFKALPLILAIAALSLVATGCGSSNTQARFVNAIPDTSDYGGGGLDVEVNSTKQFSNVTFGQASAATYVGVPSGSVSIEGLEYNTSTVVFDEQNVSLTSGKQYTLVATGFATGTNGNNVVFLNPTDDNTEPADGQVSFRVINASPSGPTAVDIWIVPAPLNTALPASPSIPSLAYKAASNYFTTSYNSGGGGFLIYVAVAGTAGNGPFIISGQSIPQLGGVSEGSIRTIVLYDIKNGTPPGMNSLALLMNDLN